MPAKKPESNLDVPSQSLALIHGDDDFAVSHRARQIYQAWCEVAGGMDHEIIDAAAANGGEASKVLVRLREALQTLPFFGGAKVVWLKNCNFLGDDRVASGKDLAELLTRLAAELKAFTWDNVRLLISAGKVDRRKGLYKTLEKLGAVEVFTALTVDDRDWQAKASETVAGKLRAAGRRIDYETLAEMVQMVGPDARALSSECEKLVLYTEGHPQIVMADVHAVVTRGRHARAFALGDALGERNTVAMLRRLDEELWAAKNDPRKSAIGLLYGLVSKVRALLFVREMLDAGWLRPAASYQQFQPQLERVPADAFPADPRLNPLAMNAYILFKALPQAKKYTRNELVRALGLLLDCNRRLVSSSTDDAFLLQQTLVRIAAV